ncbi:MAG: hydrogenase maturation protease [Thermoplasmata archaeon]|nr:hydrogenase maturation protease [Thermoplasmata archaeon]
MSHPPRPLVIGVGNLHRHDDALGLEVAEQVKERLGDRVRVVPFDGESTGLLDLWVGVGSVVIVDAIRSHGAPGQLHRFEGDLTPLLVESATTSTHGLTVGEAWRLGRSLDQLPDRLVVFGVEGEDFSPGIGLSPAVARSLSSLTGAVVAEVLRDPSVPPPENTDA